MNKEYQKFFFSVVFVIFQKLHLIYNSEIHEHLGAYNHEIGLF